MDRLDRQPPPLKTSFLSYRVWENVPHRSKESVKVPGDQRTQVPIGDSLRGGVNRHQAPNLHSRPGRLPDRRSHLPLAVVELRPPKQVDLLAPGKLLRHPGLVEPDSVEEPASITDRCLGALHSAAHLHLVDDMDSSAHGDLVAVPEPSNPAESGPILNASREVKEDVLDRLHTELSQSAGPLSANTTRSLYGGRQRLLRRLAGSIPFIAREVRKESFNDPFPFALFSRCVSGHNRHSARQDLLDEGFQPMYGRVVLEPRRSLKPEDFLNRVPRIAVLLWHSEG